LISSAAGIFVAHDQFAFGSNAVMKQLIVNADDFGMTHGVNRAIAECHRSGIVTSATIMANCSFFEDAVAVAKEMPSLAIGVHLNLSQEAPVSPPAEIPSLLNSRRELFLKPHRLLHRIASKKARLREIEIELRAQIRRVIDAGISPDHLDGHMHVHVVPGVREIVIKLAKEFGITAARCPIEFDLRASGRSKESLRARGGRTARKIVAGGISYFARRFKPLLDKSGLLYPANFTGNNYIGVLDLAALREILTSLPDGVTELMCHPGYVDTSLAASGGSLQAQREREVEALTAPEIRELLRANSIQLGTYRSAGL
jgi:chitin disaccharide deacetylase